MTASAITSEINPFLRRQIIAMATDRQGRTLLWELYDAFVEPTLTDLAEGQGRLTPSFEDVEEAIKTMTPEKAVKVFHEYLETDLNAHCEAMTVAFIGGLLAANPAAVLLGHGGAMLQNLGAPIGGKG